MNCRFCDNPARSDSNMCAECALELREWEDEVVEEIQTLIGAFRRGDLLEPLD